MNEEITQIIKPIFDTWKQEEIEKFYDDLVTAKKQYKNDPDIIRALKLALDDKRDRSKTETRG